MLAKAFHTTPERILWSVRLDRGLLYQHALLRGQDVWTIPPSAPEPEATEADFERLLTGDTEGDA
jgi:hypothetical protein